MNPAAPVTKMFAMVNQNIEYRCWTKGSGVFFVAAEHFTIREYCAATKKTPDPFIVTCDWMIELRFDEAGASGQCVPRQEPGNEAHEAPPSLRWALERPPMSDSNKC